MGKFLIAHLRFIILDFSLVITVELYLFLMKKVHGIKLGVVFICVVCSQTFKFWPHELLDLVTNRRAIYHMWWKGGTWNEFRILRRAC